MVHARTSLYIHWTYTIQYTGYTLHYTQYYTHTTHYHLYTIYTLYYTLLCTVSFVNVYKTLASWLRELRIVSLRQLSRYKLYRSIDRHLLQAGYIYIYPPTNRSACWTKIFNVDQYFRENRSGGTKIFIENFGPRTVFAGTKITDQGRNVRIGVRIQLQTATLVAYGVMVFNK